MSIIKTTFIKPIDIPTFMPKINVPDEIYCPLQERAKEKKQTVEDYINDLLKQITEKLKKQSFSKEDEETVKKRLKHLGYL